MQLSIIIVNYNVKYFLEQCLCSLQKGTAGIDAEIIVVDNASSDDSVAYLRQRFPRVQFIINPANTGYARANNLGLQQAKGKYVLFLNPDTILPEDCLEKSIRFMESHPECGACGVRMLDGNGRFLPESKRAFPSLQTSFYKLSGLTALLPQSKRFARYYLAHLSELQNQEVDVLSGAFFLTSRAVLEKTGAFDEQFFMYGEDIDLSYRLQQAGYTNYYLAETSIIHFKGQSTRKKSYTYVLLFYKAMSIFVKKHYGNGKLWTFNVIVQITIWMRATLSAMKNMFVKESPSVPVSSVTTCIIGAPQDVPGVHAVLARHPHPGRKPVVVEPGDTLKERLVAQLPDEIIFCEGAITYKSIISLMEALPKTISFKIHGACSGSIVGSNGRKSSGNVLT